MKTAKPNFAKMTLAEKQAYFGEQAYVRATPTFRPMTSKEISKMDARNAVAVETNETHYEMLQRHAKANAPSSLR